MARLKRGLILLAATAYLIQAAPAYASAKDHDRTALSSAYASDWGSEVLPGLNEGAPKPRGTPRSLQAAHGTRLVDAWEATILGEDQPHRRLTDQFLRSRSLQQDKSLPSGPSRRSLQFLSQSHGTDAIQSRATGTSSSSASRLTFGRSRTNILWELNDAKKKAAEAAARRRTRADFDASTSKKGTNKSPPMGKSTSQAELKQTPPQDKRSQISPRPGFSSPQAKAAQNSKLWSRSVQAAGRPASGGRPTNVPGVSAEERKAVGSVSCDSLNTDDIAVGVMVIDGTAPVPVTRNVLASIAPRAPEKLAGRSILAEGTADGGVGFARSDGNFAPWWAGVEGGWIASQSNITSTRPASHGVALDELTTTPTAGRRKLSGAPDVMDSVHSAWGHWFKNLVYLRKVPGPHPADFLIMLLRVRAIFPEKKWYVLAHQDTYIFAHNLACSLAGKSGSVVLGQVHCFGANFKCASGGVIFKEHVSPKRVQGWVNGGAGIAVSQAMAEAMHIKKCVEHYTTTWHYDQAAPDVVFACCSQDHGGSRVHVAGFSSVRPGKRQCSCGRFGAEKCTLDVYAPLAQRVSYHHMTPHDLALISAQEHRSEVAAHYAGKYKHHKGHVATLYSKS